MLQEGETLMKLLSKPTDTYNYTDKGLYSLFNLTENPFPSEPTVNKESTDKRINGNIYEIQIRQNEYSVFLNNFIKQPQSDNNHLRLGYLIDTSYIGRGNGKSAFLLNLINKINNNFCLDLSDSVNKCFGIYISPEPGGRNKTFASFVDLIFDSLISSNIIEICLTVIKLETIAKIYPDFNFDDINEDTIIQDINDINWMKSHNLSNDNINSVIRKNKNFEDCPPNFPICPKSFSLFQSTPIVQSEFIDYYRSLKRPKEKYDFIFSDLLKVFLTANFNGAFLFVDDFERIPDFQSSRQKKDFALELRSCVYDGYYLNSKIGFYNFLLVLHAGVPRLIGDAWASSGLDNRAPINRLAYKHVISFEKLTKEQVELLIKKYLKEFRISSQEDLISPFTNDAIERIGESSEYNAAKILRLAYEALEKAAISNINKIDEDFIKKNFLDDNHYTNDYLDIENESTIDLQAKASGEEKE